MFVIFHPQFVSFDSSQAKTTFVYPPGCTHDRSAKLGISPPWGSLSWQLQCGALSLNPRRGDSMGQSMDPKLRLEDYTLVNVYMAIERSTIFNR